MPLEEVLLQVDVKKDGGQTKQMWREKLASQIRQTEDVKICLWYIDISCSPYVSQSL